MIVSRLLGYWILKSLLYTDELYEINMNQSLFIHLSIYINLYSNIILFEPFFSIYIVESLYILQIK